MDFYEFFKHPCLSLGKVKLEEKRRAGTSHLTNSLKSKSKSDTKTKADSKNLEIYLF